MTSKSTQKFVAIDYADAQDGWDRISVDDVDIADWKGDYGKWSTALCGLGLSLNEKNHRPYNESISISEREA